MQTDRIDKSAHDFSESVEKVGTNYEKPKPDIGKTSFFLIKCDVLKYHCQKIYHCVLWIALLNSKLISESRVSSGWSNSMKLKIIYTCYCSLIFWCSFSPVSVYSYTNCRYVDLWLLLN